MKVLPRSLRILGLRRLEEALWAAGWIAVCAALEALGPAAGSDMGDGLALAAVTALGAVTAVRHRRRRIGWVAGVAGAARAVVRLARRLAIDMGVDLRERPPLRRGIPCVLVAVPLLLLGLLALLWLTRSDLPLALRGLSALTHTGYLAVLAVVWAGLAATGFFMLFLAYALVHDVLVRRHMAQGARSLRPEGVVVLAGVAAVVALAAALPVGVALVAVVALAAADLLGLLLPGNPRLRIVWRPRGRRRARLSSFDYRWIWAVEVLGVGLLIVDLALLGRGSSLDETPDTGTLHAMPVTTFLGSLCAWGGTAGWLALSVWYVHWQRIGRARNPARPLRPVVHVRGDLSRAARRRLSRGLAPAGFRVRYGARDAPRGALVVDVTDEPAARGTPLTWPPSVAVDDLLAPDGLADLGRRHAVACRRLLVRGLERVFKRAARRGFKKGSGFWVAPHLWFMVGLERDTDEEEPDLKEGTIINETIGMPYYRLMPLAARHHFHGVMRGLELDMIFVEDGVGFRRFRAVLRALFELHDVHGGGVRAEERHFGGLPGTRVIIHDFVLQEPFSSEVYPEPDYDEFGRARILHVFRDRGDDSADVPVDLTTISLPCLI